MPRKTIQKNLAYDTERQLYYAVFRQDGRRYTRTYRTREEAQAALEGNSCADRRLPGKDCTLGEWLTFWLEEVVARDRAESTLYAYRNMARCHVLPALGRIPLAELTPLRIQGYLYEKMNQGLSPNTVIKHYVMLTTALGMAVRLEMLERSPMDRVTPPKKKEARFSFYSPEQLQLLFSAVSGTMMELPVKLAAYLGLRRSEICGLRWENVDLEAGLLSIREVRTEVGGSVVLKSPKTRTSARRLGITGLQDLQQVLRRAWERRRSDDPKEWVVLRQDGAPPKPDQLTRDLLTVVRRQGLPKISLHGLRHSFASVANSQGVPMFDISRTTASLRNIRNTEEAVEQIRAATGVGVDVISGELEARLGYYGARTATDLQDGAMFDIGGGSAEVLEVRAGEVKKAQSLPIGSLELFNRCVDGLWPKKKELERIRSTVAAALKEARLPAHRAERVCGVGGTARAALKIANDWYEKPAGNRILTPAEVRRLTKLLLKRDHQARKQILRHCPDRVHTILPGIVLMDALTEALCEGELYISPYGVREGYLCHKLLNAGT